MKTFVNFAVILLVKSGLPAPVSVPIDYSYSYNSASTSSQQPSYYGVNISSRNPNAFYNRLPQNSVQVDESVGGSSNNDYDYGDQQTVKPLSNLQSNQQQSSNYYSDLNNYLLTENRHKYKKRRRIRRPCIPIQSPGSPLFSNRLGRQAQYDPETGKTFHLVLGDLNYVAPNLSPGYSDHPQHDNVNPNNNNRPQYDPSQNLLGPVQYQPVGGYPCIPVSFGHKPFGDGNHASGGPFGFFGNGGLFDFGSNINPILDYTYSDSGTRPQTVIINRPPLISLNRPPLVGFSRPPFASYGGYQGAMDSQNASSDQRPGFWGSVVSKLQEFVSFIKIIVTSLYDEFTYA